MLSIRILASLYEGSSTFKVVSQFRLEEAELQDLPTKGHKYPFALRNGKAELQVAVKSGPEKAAWLAEFIQVIDYYQKNKGTRHVGVACVSLSLALVLCVAHSQQRATVFGAPLHKILELEQRQNGIPAILEKTMQIVRERGFRSEGLFRVGGDKGTIFDYKAAWDKGQGPTLNMANVEDVAPLLKLYLRELPEPLFLFSNFEQLLVIQVQSPS